ncbi:hypothetical protein [Crateriforma spongiae]|uniref:hypothetical protein n=1 Tax=Crateriforma spongiae TaxID=2724528 RepID=UPI00197D0C41|nr:hypothetical protein [Crateriforma spongiae]
MNIGPGVYSDETIFSATSSMIQIDDRDRTGRTESLPRPPTAHEKSRRAGHVRANTRDVGPEAIRRSFPDVPSKTQGPGGQLIINGCPLLCGILMTNEKLDVNIQFFIFGRFTVRSPD